MFNSNPTSAADQVIVSHTEPGAADNFRVDFKLQVSANNGRVTFLMGAGDSYGFLLQGRTLAFDTWTHVAVTVAAPSAGDPTAARLYMNGELVAQAAQWQGRFGTRQLSAAPIEIGRGVAGGATSAFVGQVDEVRFWGTVRSQAQIVDFHRDPFLFSDPGEIPADLVAYYSFDAGPDEVVWDNSDQPWYDGTPMNGQTRQVAEGIVDVPLSPLFAPFAGPEAFGLEFTGVHAQENAARFPAALSRELPRGFTFEAWVFLESADRADHHYKTIVSRFSQQAADAQPGTFAAGSNPEADFVFQVDPRNGRLVFFMGGGRGACESAALGYGVALFSPSPEWNINAYEWTHVAFSVISSDAGNPFSARMYINGAEVPSAPELPGNEWNAACTRNYLRFDPIHLGYYDNGFAQYWEGRIDEVRFWSEPREDAAIARDYLRPLPVDTEGLLAYYLLNDGAGTVLRDGTANMFDATAQRPKWVLSQPPAELIEGVSGFPVHVTLQAHSPVLVNAAGNVTAGYPNSDTHKFVVTHLPQHGGLFTNDVPIQLLEQADVENMRVLLERLTYVSEIGYVGFDFFGYAAISDNSGLMGATHIVYIDVKPYSDGGCEFLDACGVCNGDGLSCVGGCDGKGGEIDICGICGGDGASCSCVYYKTYKTDELDCILFQSALNKTIDTIEHTISQLYKTLVGLAHFDQDCWINNFYDLGVPLDFIQNAGTCLMAYEDDLAEFESEISGHLQQCRPPTVKEYH